MCSEPSRKFAPPRAKCMVAQCHVLRHLEPLRQVFMAQSLVLRDGYLSLVPSDLLLSSRHQDKYFYFLGSVALGTRLVVANWFPRSLLRVWCRSRWNFAVRRTAAYEQSNSTVATNEVLGDVLTAVSSARFGRFRSKLTKLSLIAEGSVPSG